jgi:hypothetical protein
MSEKRQIIYDEEENENEDVSENECHYILLNESCSKSESELEFSLKSESKLEITFESKSESKKTKRKNITITKIKSDETDCKLIASCPNCEVNNALLYLVKDLSDKLNNIENELKEMKQMIKLKMNNRQSIPPINKKNVINWLNTYLVPTITFNEFVENLVVNMTHFEFLLEYKLNDTIQKIIQINVTKNEDVIYPMYSTIEKSGKIYVFNEDETWEVITIEYLSKFVKKIENKLSQHCLEWKSRYEGKNNFNSQLQEKCQQAILKLYSISYTQDQMMNRVRYDLCVQLKSVIK